MHQLECFRKYLTSASGFQSLQFRLLENKLGVISAHRVKYNAQHYREVFEKDDDKQTLSSSENEPSLFILIDVSTYTFSSKMVNKPCSEMALTNARNLRGGRE